MINHAPKFDASNIVFSFGVLSDWHIKQDAEPERDNREKLISALNQLRARAEQDDPQGLSVCCKSFTASIAAYFFLMLFTIK